MYKLTAYKFSPILDRIVPYVFTSAQIADLGRIALSIGAHTFVIHNNAGELVFDSELAQAA